MKKIIIAVIVGIIGWLGFEAWAIYRVFEKASYSFPNLKNIKEMIGGSMFLMQFGNNTRYRISATNVNITFEKKGVYMGGFNTLESVSIRPGNNDINLQFKSDTKFVQLGVDYALNKMIDYDLVTKGLYLGFIPFRYKYAFKHFI